MPEANVPWQANKLSSSCFNDLNSLFKLSTYRQWPSIEQLNTLAPDDYRFIADEAFVSDHYYEQHIHQTREIPTRRNNWHDLFNATIWSLFPRTKQLLNQWHIEDINTAGLSPRTPRRNRITQFDECGVVIAYSDSDIPQHLMQHQWIKAFYEQQSTWHSQIKPFIFGHANYEMLVDPFIGLTGKWLAVKVEPEFWQLPLKQQYQYLDNTLYNQMSSTNTFSQPHKLPPLPLLGIPNWHTQTQDLGFYQDTEHFRVKRHDKPYIQLSREV